MNMTETESRIETQKLLKKAVSDVKEFERSPEIWDAPNCRTKKGREKALTILNGQIDKYTKGRLLCKYTSQTGKTSKNTHYHWLYLECDSEYSLSHFEKKEFAISELLTFSKNPFPYSIKHAIVIKRHCLERIVERVEGGSLEGALKNMSGPLDVLIRHKASLRSIHDNLGYVLITANGYWIVKIEKGSKRTYKLTTILPRILWSGSRIKALSKVVENLDLLSRPRYDSEILEPVAIVGLELFNASKIKGILPSEAVYKFGVFRTGNVIRKTSECHLVTKVQ